MSVRVRSSAMKSGGTFAVSLHFIAPAAGGQLLAQQLLESLLLAAVHELLRDALLHLFVTPLSGRDRPVHDTTRGTERHIMSGSAPLVVDATATATRHRLRLRANDRQADGRREQTRDYIVLLHADARGPWRAHDLTQDAAAGRGRWMPLGGVVQRSGLYLLGYTDDLLEGRA
jgi:hypothetical protein